MKRRLATYHDGASHALLLAGYVQEVYGVTFALAFARDEAHKYEHRGGYLAGLHDGYLVFVQLHMTR